MFKLVICRNNCIFNIFQKNTINNKSLQKQYERKFEKVTGISIYQIIKSLND